MHKLAKNQLFLHLFMMLHPTNKILSLAMVALIALLTASCGTTKRVVATDGQRKTQGVTAPARPRVDHIEISSKLPEPTRALLAEASSWLGTRYVYGGSDRDGIDCSALVMNVYANALNIKLPRTSATQHEYCSAVDVDKVREGDLVFFSSQGSDKVGHVGIYIGDGNIIHSSSSRGVIVSALSQKYYTDNLYGFGRVDRYYAMVGEPTKKSEPVRQQKVAAPIADKTITASDFAAKGLGGARSVSPIRIAKPVQSAAAATAPVQTAEPPTASAEQEEDFLSDFFD